MALTDVLPFNSQNYNFDKYLASLGYTPYRDDGSYKVYDDSGDFKRISRSQIDDLESTYGDGFTQYMDALRAQGYIPISPTRRTDRGLMPETDINNLRYRERGLNFTNPYDKYLYTYPGSTIVNDPVYGQLLKIDPTQQVRQLPDINPEHPFQDFLKASAVAFGVPAALQSAGLLAAAPAADTAAGTAAAGSSAAGAGAAGTFTGPGTPFFGSISNATTFPTLTSMGTTLPSALPEFTGAAPFMGAGIGLGAAAGAAGAGGTFAPVTNLDVPASAADAARIGSGGGILDALTTPSVLGSIGSGVLGAIGANQQADAFGDAADRFFAMGKPSLDRFNASFAPGFNYLTADPAIQPALDTAANTAARALSTKFGNPAESPAAQGELLDYVYGKNLLPQLNTYRSQNLTGAGLGTNQAGTALGSQIQSQGSIFDALGSSLYNVTHPQKSIFDDMKIDGVLGDKKSGYYIKIG